ncbi:MAG: T9SS type A sorting domain-containing protein [Chitinophagaceae bacterium]
MRRVLLAICLQVAMIPIAYSQCDTIGIFTNPAAPVNTQRPTMLNNFNWLAQKYLINTTGASPGNDSIESPIHQIDNDIIDHLRLSLDMQPQDGWELLRREMGYEQNGTPKNPKPENPYIVMYNKYNSVMRIFYARSSSAAFTAARVTLNFSSGSPSQTSLLDLSEGLKALDTTFIPHKSFQSPSAFDNRLHKWFYVDFPMQYDPCTCYYTSRLTISVELINSADVQLSGSANGKLMAIASNSGPVNQADQTYSFADLQGAAKKGIKTFKDINKFKQGIDKALDTMLKGSPSTAASIKAGLTGLPALFKSSNFLKAGLAAAPFIGAAVSLFDFFTGGGKKAPPVGPTDVALTPTSIDMTINLSGTITSSYDYGSVIFWNPGSNTASYSDVDYPYYNEIMGIFNLLEKPKFKMRFSRERVGNPRDQTWFETEHDYILDDTIKYILNPAARLAIQEAKAALIVSGDSSDLWGPAGGAWFMEGKDQKTGQWQYRSNYYDLDCFNRQVFSIRGSSAPNNINWLPRGRTYIKFMLNLKRLVDTAGAQNVLFIAKYPIDIDNVTSINIPGTCSSNFFLPASNSELNIFCNSNTYKTNRVTRGRSQEPIVNRPQPANILEATLERAILAPNPTSSYSSLIINTNKKIRLNIFVADQMGRRVKEIASNKYYPIGNSNERVDVENLPSGIYNVVIQNGNYRVVKKLVVQR